MRVAISAGHGKYIRGASGSPVPPQLDEVDEARRVTQTTADYLRSAGVDVETWWDDISDDQSENLNRIVNWHNDTAFGGGAHDYDVSIHFNAYDGAAHGVECLYASQEQLAAKVAGAIATASGLTNRGPKYRDDLFFLGNTREKAILVETAFCDNTNDSNIYRDHYQDICRALAEAISGRDIQGQPDEPPEAERPPTETPPPSTSGRPTIGRGDVGYHVFTVQTCLKANPIDGDFGPITEDAVMDYQGRHSLEVDGIVGPMTWAALEADYHLPPYPPALPPMLEQSTIKAICDLAENSTISRYEWKDRGVAPIGYTKGMAVAWSTVLRKFLAGDPAAIEMAKANSGLDDIDALAWYDDEFRSEGMDNSKAGTDTLRHLFVLLMGLGMRESSGQHCCGVDQSADNHESDTAECGSHQTSWNINTCHDTIRQVFDQYDAGTGLCALPIFAEDVSCNEANWECYGSGDGYRHQEMSKNCPQYHVEVTAIGLRNRRQHWGPINRREAEIMGEADALFLQVQDLLTQA